MILMMQLTIPEEDEHVTRFKSIEMKFSIILISTLLIILLSSSESVIRNPDKSVQWERWQHTLKSGKGTTNQPVNIDVVFSGPGGLTFTSHAFTDDNKVFTFRAAFPASGVWNWNTICSDPGNSDLHNKTGKVNVSSYTGDNPLYKHGDLRVSGNRRYLMHYDGTPFLWTGETGWTVALKSTMDEWHYYVDTRAKQGFSVIQISPRGEGKRELASESRGLSVKKDGTPDPQFWENLEDKIAYANDKGIVILLVGTGNAWRDLMSENPVNQKFEKYITARMASYMVIFSPSFDQLFLDDLNQVAVELQKSTLHLVTQHPGTDYEANIKYRNTSVDFCGEQSGHHGGNLTKVYNAARQWTLDLWHGTPVKPVINLEGMYDAYGNNNAKNWREKDSRKCGWISWMSGAKGYTYGCGDIPPKVPMGNGAIWLFNRDSATYDFWKKAIQWPSAGEMTIMRDFFRSIEWWLLEPDHNLVLNQETSDTLKMTVSVTPDSRLLVAYLPDNPEIVLNMKDFTGNIRCDWLNPLTGEFLSTENMNISTLSHKFLKPSGWEDAVLKLSK